MIDKYIMIAVYMCSIKMIFVKDEKSFYNCVSDCGLYLSVYMIYVIFKELVLD